MSVPEKKEQFEEIMSPKYANPTIQRKVKDSCVSVYNEIQKWNSLIIQGKYFINQILQIKLSTSDSKNAFPNELKYPVEKLEMITDSLKQIVSKLKNISSKLQILRYLENSDDLASTIFYSCSISKFVEATNTIAAAYAKELDIKLMIKEEIAHQSDELDLICINVSWVQQAYIDTHGTEKLKAMLIECDLSP